MVNRVVNTYNDYIAELIERFWSYRHTRFSAETAAFDEPARRGLRPPVFARESVLSNIIVDPQLKRAEVQLVQNILPHYERHRWFGSMKSSQALVQSVFGNLRAIKLCNVLTDVQTDEGFYPFSSVQADGQSITLERNVMTLNEPRPTSVDISVGGTPVVVIECKLAEREVGQCSRPNLERDNPQHCDGSYRVQLGRQERCVLTTQGIRYWELIPHLFNWSNDHDYAACPLLSTYQLVRNVLAAAIGENNEIVPGFALLLFDERNPEFLSGSASSAFTNVKCGLRESERYRLQRLSWQTLMRVLRKVSRLQWVCSELADKYGL